MYLIGRKGHKAEAYPQANAAVAAFQDRQIAPRQTLAGFTPSGALFGVALVTPKASGIFMLIGNIVLTNGATPDVYSVTAQASTGTALVVSGGDVTVNGWTFGTSVIPVLGGSGVTPQAAPMGVWNQSLIANAVGGLSFSGLNAVALPKGVASAVRLFVNEQGGGHAVAAATVQAALIELP